MDRVTVVYYALGYVGSMIVIFLLFLPAILSFVLLLLVAAAVQLVALFLEAAGLAAYRGLAWLFRSPAGWVPQGPGNGRLTPP